MTTTNSGTTTSTTTGVMHNLPVLWLVVGLQSLCHAPVPIVGHLKVALLLYVVHAVQCAVFVPGLCSRQQWQLVWAGPRVLLCSRAEPGRPGRCGQPWHKGCGQQKGPGFSLSLSAVALTTPIKGSASDSNGLRERSWKWWEDDDSGPDRCGFGSAFVQWTDLLQIYKSACRNLWFLIFTFFLFLFFGDNHDALLSGMLWWLQIIFLI